MSDKKEISVEDVVNISYLNGLTVAFHLFRELGRSIENIALDKDISYRDKKDKILDNYNLNLNALEAMLASIKGSIEDSGIKLKFNLEQRAYDIEE